MVIYQTSIKINVWWPQLRQFPALISQRAVENGNSWSSWEGSGQTLIKYLVKKKELITPMGGPLQCFVYRNLWHCLQQKHSSDRRLFWFF